MDQAHLERFFESDRFAGGAEFHRAGLANQPR
jgi:hypothetical protein